AICERVLYDTKVAIKPGMRENELVIIQSATALRAGAEAFLHTSVASGDHTNPAYIVPQATDRIIRHDELVFTDLCVVGPGGYVGDVSRTYLCGSKATDEQRELYLMCYEWMEGFRKVVRPGLTLKEVAEKAPRYPNGYEQTPLPYLSHSVGLHLLATPMIFWNPELNAADEIKPNMVITNQGYALKPGGGQGVYMEDMLLVTETGCEIIGKGPHDERMFDL
ncbi:MAG: M24 family metallopeptidase, partial [Candidatus Bathyarchaeia archaeon]